MKNKRYEGLKFTEEKQLLHQHQQQLHEQQHQQLHRLQQHQQQLHEQQLHQQRLIVTSKMEETPQQRRRRRSWPPEIDAKEPTPGIFVPIDQV